MDCETLSDTELLCKIEADWLDETDWLAKPWVDNELEIESLTETEAEFE